MTTINPLAAYGNWLATVPGGMVPVARRIRGWLEDLVAGFSYLDHAGDIAKATAVDMIASDRLENL